jgi:hypothetical protein
LNASQVGDNAEVWYQPANWIRIEAGKFQNNDIRGRMSANAWFGDYTIARAGESDIFTNFNNPFGALVKLSPVDGLNIYATLKSGAGYNNWTPWGASRGAEWVWKNTQVAVSYAIPNLGLARAQFVGPEVTPLAKIDVDKETELPKENDFSRKVSSRAEAAFAFTSVPGLTLDVGGKFWFPVSDPETDVPFDSESPFKNLQESTKLEDYSYSGGIDLSLGLTYAASPLTATFIISAAKIGAKHTLGSDEEKMEMTSGLEVKPHVAVQYKLNDTFSAQVEGGVFLTGESKAERGGESATYSKGSLRYGFGAGLQTTVAPSCTIRTGITYAGGKDNDTEKNLLSVFSVPIIFSVSF